MSGPFKFTVLGLSGEHTVYKKQVNVISSKIIEGHGRGKVVSEKVGKCKGVREMGSHKVGN